MIDRLTSTHRELAVLSADELAANATIRLRDDCADAARLELDCPQQALTRAQRTALSRLCDALEESTSPQALVEIVRDADSVIGLAEPASRARDTPDEVSGPTRRS